MRIALYQPDIAQNTGTILRLAACLNVAVDIIEPAGFDLSVGALKRAALDYFDKVKLKRYGTFADFKHDPEIFGCGLILLTTRQKLLSQYRVQGSRRYSCRTRKRRCAGGGSRFS